MPDYNRNLNTDGRISPRLPADKDERDGLRDIASDFVTRNGITPPVSLNKLKEYREIVIDVYAVDGQYADYLVVCLNNHIWKDTVASVPFEKRLLLLPKCLRHSKLCPGDFDSFGLVCKGCGRCVIASIKNMAETLGYTVLIAEGSPIVMSLISTGQIQAVIGVSCMPVLEQTFPYMEAGAIPGIAFPLLFEGCKDTEFDIDRLEETLSDFTNSGSVRTNLAEIKEQTIKLFTKEKLCRYFDSHKSPAAEIALDWMARSGKRFRPLITASVFMTLCEEVNDGKEFFPRSLQDVAVAIECFHKASLIHDDIEDDDDYRYGLNTLHCEQGVPIALNTGDFLLGLGYRIIASADVPDKVKVKMLRAAADAHHQLCVGQGNELARLKNPSPLSVEQVLDIFQDKTSPAFEVALKLGLQLAQSGEPSDEIVAEYCKYLGIAYQVLDDIDDFDASVSSGNYEALKPSLHYALAWRDADSEQRNTLGLIWSEACVSDNAAVKLKEIFSLLSVKRKALDMLHSYKLAAIESISPIEKTSLKSLLRIIISRIFNELEIMSCCDDYSPPDD